jgi:putative addiction module component (TIGR02574 family)
MLEYVRMEDLNMPIVAKKVLDEVLLLPADARVRLVEQLLTSLNLPTQPEVYRLWAKEAERRIAQIDKGRVKLLSGQKVFSDIRKKYQR